MENARTSGCWLVASLLAFAVPVLAQDFSPALLRAMPVYQQCVRGEAAAFLKDRKLRPNELLERAFVACKTEEEMVQSLFAEQRDPRAMPGVWAHYKQALKARTIGEIESYRKK